MNPIYLDHCATTPIHPSVYEAMKPYLTTTFGNPSSVHKAGVVAKKAINDARESMARLLHCQPEEITFTSGGTESINMALKGLAEAYPNKMRIVTTKIEHQATLKTVAWLEHKGYEIVYVDVDHKGLVNLDMLEKSLNQKTLCFSIIWANNEIGTIQDLNKILTICHRHDVLVHVDAVQMIGKTDVRFDRYPIDLMTWTSHKIFGPKGIGALYVRNGIHIAPLIHGGGQEKGLRSGTENVKDIIGFSQAMTLSYLHIEEKNRHLDMLSRTLFERFQSIVDVSLIGASIGCDRIPGHLSLCFKDRDAFQLSLAFNRKSIYVSTGSACHANSLDLSHVVRALPENDLYQQGMIRLSFAHEQSVELIDEIIQRFQEI